MTLPQLAVVGESTHGIIFFGTPHKGAQLAVWGKNLAKAVGAWKQTNSSIVAQLAPGSKDLSNIDDAFDIHLRSRVALRLPKIETKCYYEEHPMTGIGLVRQDFPEP